MSAETVAPETFTMVEAAQRPLSAELAQLATMKAGLMIEEVASPEQQPIVLVRQFGRYQDVETGEVWAYGDVKKAAPGTVHVVEAERV